MLLLGEEARNQSNRIFYKGPCNFNHTVPSLVRTARVSAVVNVLHGDEAE